MEVAIGVPLYRGDRFCLGSRVAMAQAGGQRPPWERDLQALAGMGKLRAWSVNLPRRAPP